MLQLKVLGSLGLTGATEPVPSEARQRRRIALLALLALSEDHGISRERLQAFLWPESSTDRARHALDQLVYATRRSLGVDPVLSEASNLRLDPTVVDSDLRQFSMAIRDNRLEDAARLYSGALLDGFHISESRELEAWLDGRRSQLEHQYQKALDSLACTALEQGDHESVISWRLKLSESDPLSSRIASETIRAYISAGENASAIQHARHYQHLVRKELEVEPDPSIEKLISSLPRALTHQGITQRAGEPTTDQTPRLAIPASNSRHDRTVRRRVFAVALIAFMIVLTLAAFLARSTGEHEIVARAPTNREARALYLRGTNSWNNRSKAALDTAVVYFRKAIDEEPDFAEAYAGLANAYVMIGYSGYRPADAMFPKAKAAALRTIELDSTMAAPYSALGMELTWERKFNQAEAAFRKSIARDPAYATAHQWYGILLMIVGKTDSAVAETGRAAELEPLSLQIQNNYATFLSAAGRKEDALRHYQKTIGEEPDTAWVRRNPWLLTNMAGVYAANGQFDKAIRFAQGAVEILPGHPRAASALAGLYYTMGRKDKGRATFAQADTANEHYAAYRGLFYVTEGKPDSAFIWFDRVREWGIPIMIGLPRLRESPVVGRDPRLGALYRRLGLPYSNRR